MHAAPQPLADEPFTVPVYHGCLLQYVNTHHPWFPSSLCSVPPPPTRILIQPPYIPLHISPLKFLTRFTHILPLAQLVPRWSTMEVSGISIARAGRL